MNPVYFCQDIKAKNCFQKQLALIFNIYRDYILVGGKQKFPYSILWCCQPHQSRNRCTGGYNIYTIYIQYIYRTLYRWLQYIYRTASLLSHHAANLVMQCINRCDQQTLEIIYIYYIYNQIQFILLPIQTFTNNRWYRFVPFISNISCQQ